jgi:hypothetical protein
MFAMYRSFQSQETAKLVLWFSLNILHRNFFNVLHSFSPNYFIFFYLTLIPVFGKIVGFGSLVYSQVPSMCPHVSLLISREGSTSQCDFKYFHLHCKKMQGFMCCVSKSMSFHHLHLQFNRFINELALCCEIMTFASCLT